MRWRLLVTALLAGFCGNSSAQAWTDRLQSRVESIDRETPGRLGVYVKRLDTGEAMSYQADRPWYLGSALKVPIALAMLKDVEDGRHTLDETVALRADDKVDGSGPLVWQAAGTRYSVADLLKGMLMVSDNTAANMLVRLIGVERWNDYARQVLALRGFSELTDFTQVRYAVYRELSPAASRLSNRQLLEIAAAPVGPRRVDAFRRQLSLPTKDLAVSSLGEAYERYYKLNRNAVTLESYAQMLERLVRGRLLSAAHMQWLYTNLKYDSYDAYRLEAGLPRSVRFIHKTGTQYRRACHAGVIEPQIDAAKAIVVVTCAEDLDEHREAGAAFEQIGRAIAQTLL